MSENQVSRRIEALITPVLADLGLEMYDLEYNGGIVKITVFAAKNFKLYSQHFFIFHRNIGRCGHGLPTESLKYQCNQRNFCCKALEMDHLDPHIFTKVAFLGPHSGLSLL